MVGTRASDNRSRRKKDPKERRSAERGKKTESGGSRAIIKITGISSSIVLISVAGTK